jgi:hypothetical protein
MKNPMGVGAVLVLAGTLLRAETPRAGVSWDLSHGPLKVSANNRYLVHQDGTPFFWLGDTAWELFHRLNRSEVEQYLENRRAKGFTVIQAVALAELDGLNTPNAHGDRPLLGNNPETPDTTPGSDPANATQYDYWDHVDYVVNTAQSKGIYIGMLPTWGSHVVGGTIHAGNAETYGRFLGRRYGAKPVIWILGGDRSASGYESVWRAMAKGIAIGVSGSEDYSRVLMTYHPPGGNTSSTWFHNDGWLDFNMLQTGHGRDTDVWNRITSDYNRAPTKPVLDGEPTYEDHPISFNPSNGYATDYDVRKFAYWDLFAGAHGHTYGCHNIWQMYAPGRTAISWAHAYWYDSLDFAGAWDMMHVRNLMLSRPVLSRVPDQSIVTDARSGGDRIQATRGDGYLFVYSASGQSFTVNPGKISGTTLKGWWFDPRAGTSASIGTFGNAGQQAFSPPSTGTDWVLVLDDASRGFSAPGSGTATEPPPPPPPTPSPGFVKGINFNGSAVTIEGNPWVSYSEALSSGLSVSISPNLATTGVTPNPATDADTAAMLNTAIWSSGGFGFSQALADGDYDVSLWVVENYASNARSFDVRMEGASIVSGVGNLAFGAWEKYGPYRVSVSGGALDVELVRVSGDPHVMGMSISSVSGGGSGLNYAHYHGDWDRLPDFGALAPVKTGSVAGFDLSPRTRDDQFGFVFWGSVEIPTAGDYTFFTSSDDGSQLSIDGSLVVDNDGLHGIAEASGAVTLSAGPHAIRVTYFDQSGGQHLEVSWQGPGIAKGPIPATALSTVVAGGGGRGSSGSDGDEGCGLLGLEVLLLLLAGRRRS